MSREVPLFPPACLLVLLLAALALPGAEAGIKDPLAGCKGPWKVQITLYDHPNAANASTDDATLLEEDALIVPISVTWRSAFTGYDWYEVEDALHLNLISRDRGISWQVYGGSVPERSLELRDGSLLRVKWLGYRQHPIEELARWEAAGYWIYMIPEKKLFATTGGFLVEVSRDKGRTWQPRPINLPHRAFLAGYGMHTARILSDGTILMPAFGYLTRRHKTYACSIIRSADGGATWDVITIAQDERSEAVSDSDTPSGSIWANFPDIKGFDEASIVEAKKPRRVIAVIEESQAKDLYSCISNDSGRTWTKAKKTGMAGVAPLLLRLKSGAIACAYTNRYSGSPNDRGMRVCLSHDDGKTWDTEHPIILKDDNARADAQGLWNLLQFSDGTLFACGSATKTGCGGGNEIGYAVGFRFTEDFRTPLRAARAPRS